MLKSIIAPVAVAAAIVAAITPAAASAGTREAASITVDVRDLDLTQPADRARADRRVNAAIRSLCNATGERGVAARNAEAACRAEALASVRPLGF
jgi:UrcA family protein